VRSDGPVSSVARPQPVAGGLRFFRTDGSELRFQRGRGGLVYTDAGTPYVDFVLGMGPVSIGHGNVEFTRRLGDALRDGVMLPTLTSAHEEYASLVLRDTPHARVVCYCKTGSEAVTGALRLAALHTGRKGVIRCGYVGWHDVQLASTPNWNELPGSPRRTALRFDRHMRGAAGDEAAANWLDFDPAPLERLTSTDVFGAFVIDAYQIELTSRETIVRAIDLCRRRGIVVIVDETKTAGRATSASAYVRTDIDADLTVLGKAIGNGFPISVLVQHRDFDAAARATRIGGTFSKECVSVHAALITAALMEERQGYAALAAIGTRVVSLFQDAAQATGVDAIVSCRALLGGRLFEFRYAPDVAEDLDARQMFERCCADRGVLLMEGHCSFVCLDHDALAWDRLADASTQAMRDWKLRIRA